jgi:GTP-binding protein
MGSKDNPDLRLRFTCLEFTSLHQPKMDIISAKYVTSSPGYKQCPVADRPEYAFIGRSNVGKSSLINMLAGQKALAKTSATPGKTQLINHFELIGTDRKSWYLVDLPGYGYATVSRKARHNWENMIESYIRKRENLVCLFVLVDSRHEPQQVDLDFINRLGEWQVPFVLLFTKSDKSKPGAVKRNVEDFLKALEDNWEEHPPHFITSALNRGGRAEVLAYIASLNSGFARL